MNSTEPPIGQLHPLNDCVLVELEQKHKQFATREGKYDSRTEGIVIDTSLEDVSLDTNGETVISKKVEWLIGKRVHFEEFKEGSRIERGGKLYSFIKIEDIRGWEDIA